MTRYTLFLAPALLAFGLVGCMTPDCGNSCKVGHTFGDDGLVDRTRREPAPMCPTCGRNVAWPIDRIQTRLRDRHPTNDWACAAPNGKHIATAAPVETPPIRVQAAKPALPMRPDSYPAPPETPGPISPYAPLRFGLHSQHFSWHDEVAFFCGPIPPMSQRIETVPALRKAR